MIIKGYFIFIVSVVMLTGCVPYTAVTNTSTHENILMDNVTYNSIVGNVQLFFVKNGKVLKERNPVIQLGTSERLLLDFDILHQQPLRLHASISHCNRDWRPSVLLKMEYMSGFDPFIINNFQYSVNTKVPYTNFQMPLPSLLISGNYVVTVFRSDGQPLFSRRFMVVSSQVILDGHVARSQEVSQRQKRHRIIFEMYYPELNANSPTKEFSAVLLQNHNWHTALSNIRPSRVEAARRYVSFEPWDNATDFDGCNEYRFADLRTVDVASRNVKKIFNYPNKLKV